MIAKQLWLILITYSFSCNSAENVSFKNVSLSDYHKEIVRIPSGNNLKSFLPRTPYHYFVIVSGRIPVLYENSVTDIDNVHELYFRKNAIEDIEPGAFRNLTSVHQLAITHSKLETIKDGVFHNLTLHELKVSYSDISKIEPGMFGNLSKLTALGLDNNKIQTIEENVFANLTNLQILDLSGNLLSTIPNFTYLQDLKTLILASNQFSQLNKEDFLNSNIAHLDLTNNKISTIPEDFLDAMPNLQRIILSHNKLTTVPKGIFNNRDLLQVELNNNKISFIDPEAFDNMTKLANILLNVNQIKSYNPRWFQNTPNIYRLFLLNNLLEEIPDEAFKNIYNQKKQWLKLGGNKIRTVTPEAFKGFKYINNLDLSHNEIENWDANILADAESVDFLNLIHNRIECPEGDFDKVFIANKTYLEGNPLEEECVTRIKQWQNESPEKVVYMSSKYYK